MDLFVQLSVIVVVTLLLAALMHFLRQPLIIGYILAGIIAGPYLLDIAGSEILSVFSHVGVALLLFIVGLGLSPSVIRDVGKVSVITGVGQVVFTSVIGFVICLALGFSSIEAIFIAVALTFSSTIIIMKLLSDKREAESLYGRIAIGFLIVQDIIAIVILMAVSTKASGNSVPLILTAAKGLGLIALAVAAGAVLPYLTKFIAKSQEFLLLFSLGWCLALSAMFFYAGFSIEIGALLAGITLSISPLRVEIGAKMRPLRDFFIVIFFILLGSQMQFTHIQTFMPEIIILSLFILIGNPLIVMLLMGIMGYTKRNGFLAGLTVAQISEFSLILIALGVNVGYLKAELLSLVTAVGLITIAGSTYLILYANKIYPVISRFLSVFERKGKKVEEKNGKGKLHDVILFGCDRMGHEFMEAFRRIGKKPLVIDYNPDVVKGLAKKGIDCIYGDANDSEFLGSLKIANAKMVASTIPHFETNLLLLTEVKRMNPKCIVIAMAHRIDDAMELYKKGASYVILPHFLSGHHVALMIKRFGMEPRNFKTEKEKHIAHLLHKKKLGHEHPLHEK
ncbi:MAG: cation:proton antiporter [Nanoarchaeota archaeon]|nr:cation:proton antiporter [Nanoarchaeota archaeon]